MLKKIRSYGELTRLEKLDVDNLIRDNGNKPCDDYWQYDPGWDDRRIANNFGITRQSVCAARASTFGKIAPKSSFGLDEDASVSEIRDLLFRIEEKIDNFVDTFS